MAIHSNRFKGIPKILCRNKLLKIYMQQIVKIIRFKKINYISPQIDLRKNIEYYLNSINLNYFITNNYNIN